MAAAAANREIYDCSIGFLFQFSAGLDTICLKPEQLPIPKDRGFSIGQPRKKTINIFVPTNCRNGKPVIPKSDEQLLQFLDLSLPLDLKSGAVQGCGSSATGRTYSTVYRSDADWVVLRRLAELWKYSDSCKKILGKDKTLLPVACTVSFYNLYRANFMRRDSTLIDREPAQIPTAEELDEKAKSDPACREE